MNKEILDSTKALYCENSKQYSLHKILLEAKGKLKETGILELGKMCKNEYITITYTTDPVLKCDNTIYVVKSYWDKGRTVVRREKSSLLKMEVSDLIDNVVYRNVSSEGYEVLLN